MNPRIISLLPSATEIVAALGLSDALVGCSHECDYPPLVKQLPACTSAQLNTHKPSGEIDTDVRSLLNSALSIYQLKIEIIEELQPTHIITQDQCDVCAVSFSAVEKAVQESISTHPQVISLQPNLLQQVWQDIERVADAFHVPAQPLLQELQVRIDNIVSQTVNLAENELPTVVALEWTEPLMGAGNWIPELIEMAGGKPILAVKGQHSPYLSWENLADADPDVIVIMPCGFNLERTRQESQVLTQHPFWRQLRAVKQSQVFITDGNAYFNRPGPRLVDSLEILADLLHPDQFKFGYCAQAWTSF